MFTPQQIDPILNDLEECFDETLQSLSDRNSFDLLVDLLQPYSWRVICRFLGIKANESEMVADWSRTLVDFIDVKDASFDQIIEVQKLVNELMQFVKEICHSSESSNLFLAALRQISRSRAMTNDELTAVYANILVDGHGPIAHVLTNGYFHLIQNEKQLSAVKGDHTLLPKAVEEVLRIDTPFQLAGRTVTESMIFRSTQLQKGDKVLLILASANRDENIFPNPDCFDLFRDNSKHRSFGLGGHYCIGAYLARKAIEIALKRILESFSDMRMAKMPEWNHSMGYRTLNGFYLQR